MWTETKRGYYKKFIFSTHAQAWDFVIKIKSVFDNRGLTPRWANDSNIVEIWVPLEFNEHQMKVDMQSVMGDIDAISQPIDFQISDIIDDKNTTKITEIKLFADGGSRGNPGHSASGFVLLDMDDNVLYREGVYLGITTNNQAEYQALKLGLEHAHRSHVSIVHVFLDSLLVVNQMKGIFQVKNRDLWPVHEAIRRLIEKFEAVDFTHVPREMNKLADAEVNKCLDAKLAQAEDSPE